MKVLVLGTGGNLGRELFRTFTEAGFETVGLDRAGLDVTDGYAVARRILNGGYGAVLNAVAWNDVDGAEKRDNHDACWGLNALAPHHLARACRMSGSTLVHFSTDYVFKGDKPEGYAENDEPYPDSEYGKSKLAGERAIMAAGGTNFIVRTSRLFGPPGLSPHSKPSFVATMLKLAKEKSALSIVDEEVGCPTYTRDLAEATVKLLDGYDEGIYHLVNGGPGVTWYGFAEELFGIAGITTPRKPVPATPRPAPRPKFAPLRNTVGPKLRSRVDALRAFLSQG